MITKLIPGDTVIAKHPVCTDGMWKKGVIYQVNDSYEIRFSYDNRILIINKTDIVYDIKIIKVNSDFDMRCNNCRHCDKRGNDYPCCRCLGRTNYSRWEPCDSLKYKNKLNGLDINAFSIDEGPFTDKKVDYSYISTNLCEGANKLTRKIHDQLSAGKLKIEKLDMKSFYPNFYERDLPTLPDNIDTLRYCVDDARVLAEFMADFNKKENKNMKKQQKRRNRNILVVKDLNTAIEFDEIIFNGPATIIKWKRTFDQAVWGKNPDKTVVVCKEPDKLDKTTGFLLAVLKEVLDNKSYGNILEKIDEINKFDELSKQTVEADLNSKHNECPKETVALLNEAAEAMANAFHIGSRVKYIHGKLVYRVIDCTYIPTKHEMYYTLSAYQRDILSGHETPKVYNVAHHRLKQVKRV